MKSIEKKAKYQFGRRLVEYRDAAGISQTDLATGLDKQQPYIVKVESGQVSIGIDLMEEFSTYFGVAFYEMADPWFKIPSKEKLRHAIREYHVLMDTDPEYLNNPSPNYTKNLDKYLKTAYLREPKTSKQIASDYAKIYDQQIPPSKVSDILCRSPRKELLEISKKTGSGNVYKLK